MPRKSPYGVDLHDEEAAELQRRARKYTLPYCQVLRAQRHGPNRTMSDLRA